MSWQVRTTYIGGYVSVQGGFRTKFGARLFSLLSALSLRSMVCDPSAVQIEVLPEDDDQPAQSQGDWACKEGSD